MATRRACDHAPSKLLPPGASFLGMDISGAPDYSDWYLYRDCPEGWCEESVCPVCGAVTGGAGPVGCPCQKLSPLPDQRPMQSVPDLGRRRRRRTK